MNNRTNITDVLNTVRFLIQEKPECFRDVPRRTITNIAEDSSKPEEIASKIIKIIVNIKPSEAVIIELIRCFTQIIYLSTSGLEAIDDKELDRLRTWLQKVYEENADAEISVLIAISYFIKNWPKYGTYFCEKVFHPTSKMFAHLEEASSDLLEKWRYMLPIVQCTDALITYFEATTLTEIQIKFCTKILTSLIQILQCKTPVNLNNSEYTFFIFNSLALLQKIAALCTKNVTDQSDKLLGLATAYMFYNEENFKDFAPPLIQSSQRMRFESLEEINSLDSSAKYESCKGKAPKLHKPRVTITNRCTARQVDLHENHTNTKFDSLFSDSDISEQEVSKDASYMESRHHFVKIRLTALKLLETIAQDKRILYSYWHIIFPHDLKNTPTVRNDLLYVSQKDPSTKCRYTSLLVGTQLILCSKGFLSQAKYVSKDVTCAFQPYSQNLGQQVLDIYEVLSSILVTECSMSVVIQALKCLTALIQATPFHRIECECVKPLLKTVQELVFHSDITTQLAALTVFEFLVVIPNIPPEISEAMGFCKTVEKIYTANTANMYNLEDRSTNEFWLLRNVLCNLSCSRDDVESDLKAPALVRLKSLQMLTAMAVHFKDLLFDSLDQIAISLTQAFCDQQSDILLYASRFLDNLAYQMDLFLLDNDSNDCVGNCMKFWIKMLPIVMEHIQNEQNMSTLKVSLCDGLSNIGVVIFEHLPSRLQINLLSFLSGVSSEITEETTVRAAAARALSVFTLFPLLRGNLVFIENTAESILPLMGDSNLIVRIKSSWALGNVSDALLSTTSSNTDERISDTLLFRMINITTTACSDNDKVRCNAVRTVGNLLYLLTETHFHNGSNRMVINASVNKLTECVRTAGNAKVKWNTCYAIGNFMRNDSLFLATNKYEDLDWLLPLYAALRYVIGHHSNYKVRINATSAILSINSRSHFSNDFENFWIITLEAIEQSYNLHNFYEYNHRDQLQEKLCLVMCHLIKLAKLDEFIALKRSLSEKVEIVKNTWMRVVSRMIPEKCATLFLCPVLLQELLKKNFDLNIEQKRAIEFIIQATTVSQ